MAKITMNVGPGATAGVLLANDPNVKINIDSNANIGIVFSSASATAAVPPVARQSGAGATPTTASAIVDQKELAFINCRKMMPGIKDHDTAMARLRELMQDEFKRSICVEMPEFMQACQAYGIPTS